MIRLTKEIGEKIVAEGEKSYPNECCGILIGRETEDGDRDITELYVVENHFDEDEKYHRFSIDPKDYLRAERAAADAELSVLGVYHSHPDHPAEPSEYDRNAAFPYYSYVIVAVANGRAEQTTSWQLKTDRSAFIEEHVDVY